MVLIYLTPIIYLSEKGFVFYFVKMSLLFLIDRMTDNTFPGITTSN